MPFCRGIDDSRPGEVSDDMSILQVSCFCYVLTDILLMQSKLWNEYSQVMVSWLLKLIILYICHMQGDIEALTLQEHSLDEQIRLVTSYLSSSVVILSLSIASQWLLQ
jgi:hypothetical protein